MDKEISLARISEKKQELFEQGCKATDVIFPYPLKGDVLIIGEYKILCVRGIRDTRYALFGMHVWVDETLKGDTFYIVDKNEIVTLED